MPRAYYNEIEPAAVHVLRALIDENIIAPGDVDDRSIKEVRPSDLIGYTQCHFFAGGGLWSVALRLAGWPDERPVWTGSCPCQPFSQAGKGLGRDDPRHLWPDFHRLIAGARPDVVFGEQVAGAAGYDWFDGVSADLEREGYACEAFDLPAAAVDAPHIRQRLYWVGKTLDHTTDSRCWNTECSPVWPIRDKARGEKLERRSGDGQLRDGTHVSSAASGTANAPNERREWGGETWRRGDEFKDMRDMEHAESERRRERRAEHEVRSGRDAATDASSNDDMADANEPCASEEWEQRSGQFLRSREDQRACDSCGDRTSGVANANGRRCGRGPEASQRGPERGIAVERIGGDVANAANERCDDGAQLSPAFGTSRNGSFWSDHEWRPGADGKARRVKPGVRLLVDGLSKAASAVYAIEREANERFVDACSSQGNADKVLQILREAVQQEEDWEKKSIGVLLELHEAEILLDFLFCIDAARNGTSVEGRISKTHHEARRRLLRSMWPHGKFSCSPYRRRRNEQVGDEFADFVLSLPFVLARFIEAHWQAVREAYASADRVSHLRIAGNAIVPQLAAEFIKAFMESEQ